MSIDKADIKCYQLKKSVKKALIGKEMPLKEKHVRTTILWTYYHQGPEIFWSIAIKQPIMENRFTAWKFSHLLHKILRDGHNLCCQEFHRNIKFINDLGKFWCYLTDGYGLCISQYTKLLVIKIEFHVRNPKFPGTLNLSNTEIEEIISGDINVIFQLTIEIFDYFDALIALQAIIFKSLQTYLVNYITLEGQCRIAALVPCIEDANSLYVLALQFMVKLHEYLPYAMLEGHRERFNTVFDQLKSFYELCQFVHILNSVSIPNLPEQIPNFSPVWEINEYPLPSAPPPEE